MYQVNILLFEKFETLDVFGPVEVLGSMPDIFALNFLSCQGGIVTSAQSVRVDTSTYVIKDKMKNILFIPGGVGMMDMLKDKEFIGLVDKIAEESQYILTVCTGSALLAKAGKLNGKKATTNKRLFLLISSKFEKVTWIKQARWVVDGTTYTSSGVSAGIDMTLGFIANVLGREKTQELCNRMEYVWNEDSRNDPFAKINGLV
ncbi:DJ-1/PfpI family protein [bacterium]|nr:DJ-1/PfpI family protein [bacterium]